MHGVDDVGHSDVGMEASMIGHLGLLHIGTVTDGIDVTAALHLEVLVHPQSTIAGQDSICQAKSTQNQDPELPFKWPPEHGEEEHLC